MVFPATRRYVTALLVLLIATALFAAPARAIYGEPAATAPLGDADFDQGLAAVKSEDWVVAVAALERAAVKHRDSADVFNLLGYAYRKQRNLDRAFANYHRALALDPSHRGAHEYIGEAYLMAGNLVQAVEHLAILERLCSAPSRCEEYHDLARAIAAYRAAAPAR